MANQNHHVNDAKNPSGVKSESLISQVEGLATARPWSWEEHTDHSGVWLKSLAPQESPQRERNWHLSEIATERLWKTGGTPDAETRANFDLICRAVNSFDALVEAAKAILIDVTDDDSVEPFPYLNSIKKLRAALKLAEGKSQCEFNEYWGTRCINPSKQHAAESHKD